MMQRYTALALVWALILSPLTGVVAAPALAPSQVMPMREGEVWIGHYICFRRHHKAQLEILKSEGTEADAVLEFTTPDGRTGRVRLSGAYSPSSLNVRFKVAQWIERPHGITFHDWLGTVTNRRSRYQGTVQDPENTRNAEHACTNFDIGLVLITPRLASMEAAKRALKKGDKTTYMAHLQGLAANGEREAQYKLGLLFEEGYKGKPQPKSAYHWYKKAAAQGHTEAEKRRKALESVVSRDGGIPPALKWTALALGGAYVAKQLFSGNDSGKSGNPLASALNAALGTQNNGGGSTGTAAVAGTVGAAVGAKAGAKAGVARMATKSARGKGLWGILAAIIVGVGACIRRVRSFAVHLWRSAHRGIAETRKTLDKEPTR